MEMRPLLEADDRSKIEFLLMPAPPPALARTSKNPTASATSSSEMGVVLMDGKDADGNPVTTWEIAR